MPTLKEFITKAAPLNPALSEDDLTQYWEENYVQDDITPATDSPESPTWEEFQVKAAPLNPEMSPRELNDYWKSEYGVETPEPPSYWDAIGSMFSQAADVGFESPFPEKIDAPVAPTVEIGNQKLFKTDGAVSATSWADEAVKIQSQIDAGEITDVVGRDLTKRLEFANKMAEEEKFFAQDPSILDKAKSAGLNLVSGIVNTTASILQGHEISALDTDWGRLSNMAKTDLDVSTATPLQLEALKIRKVEAERLREKLTSKDGMKDYFTGSDWIKSAAPDLEKLDPRLKRSFGWSKVPNAFGSATTFMGVTAALNFATRGKAGPIGNVASIATMGSLAQGASEFEEALNDPNASFEDALDSYAVGRLVGTSEAFPLARILNRLDKASAGTVKKAVKNMLVEGTEEALQETFQTVMSNLVKSDIVGYNPDQKTWVNAEDGAAVGFTTGTILSFLGSLVAGKRMRNFGKEMDAQVADTDLSGRAEQAATDLLNPQSYDSDILPPDAPPIPVPESELGDTTIDIPQQPAVPMFGTPEPSADIPQQPDTLDLLKQAVAIPLPDPVPSVGDTTERSDLDSLLAEELQLSEQLNQAAQVFSPQEEYPRLAIDDTEIVPEDATLRTETLPSLPPEGYAPSTQEGEMEPLLPVDQPTTDSIETDFSSLQIVEVPVDELQLSEDVPQFKSGADESGVIDPLGGTFDRTGVGPIQIWVRENGDKEVISGRHRLDLAQRSGEETIPAQYHYESAGFDQKQAASLDATLNIRDEQGEVQDYVEFFRNSSITQEHAEEQGLLARAKGKMGYGIATQGDDVLVEAHRSGSITNQQAFRISSAAPNNARLQTLGLIQLQNKKSLEYTENIIRAVQSMGGESDASQGDMFGLDDSAVKEAEALAQAASNKQKDIQARITAGKGAAKNPGEAKKLGIDVRDARSVLKQIAELRAEKDRWSNWHTDPELVAELRDDAGLEQQEESFNLDTQTEGSLQQQEEQQAEAQTKEDADKEVEGFDLTGQNVPTDESMDQGDLLAQPEEPTVNRGTVGMMLATDEVVTTQTGRETTPFPTLKFGTNRQATNTDKRVVAWLVNNAINEAKSRGDEFNTHQFEAINLKNVSKADKDSAEEYLFGDSIVPSVPKILKPLIPETEQTTPQVTPELTKSGTPYKSQQSAQTALKLRREYSPETHEIVEVDGGFGVVKKVEGLPISTKPLSSSVASKESEAPPIQPKGLQPTFRNPDNYEETWTGRGRSPAWVNQAEKKYGGRDKLRIVNQETETSVAKKTTSTPKQIESLIEQYNATGRVAFYYPRKKEISLNGGRAMKEVDAIGRMREVLAGEKDTSATTKPETTDSNPMRDVLKKYIKNIQGINNLYGKQNAATRQALMSELTGKKVPKVQAGITALKAKVFEVSGIDTIGGKDTLAQREKRFDAWLAAAEEVPTNTTTELLESYAQEQDAVATDWASREYKDNDKTIDLSNNELSGKGYNTIGNINAGRRARKVDEAKGNAKLARQMVERLRSGEVTLESIYEKAQQKAEVMDRNGQLPDDLSSEEKLQYVINKDLGGAGTWGEGTLGARVIELAQSEAEQSQAHKEKFTDPETGEVDLLAAFLGDETQVGKSTETANPVVTKPTSTSPSAPIEDVGEKIGGARKDVWGGFRDKVEADLTEDELLKMPLSKAFPEPNYEKLIEQGVPVETLAIIKVMRNEIPAKGRQTWKRKRWGKDVAELRSAASMMMDDPSFADKFLSGMRDQKGSLNTLAEQVDLMVELGFPQVNAAGYVIEYQTFKERNPESEQLEEVSKWMIKDKKSKRGWPYIGKGTESREEAVEVLKAHLAVQVTRPKGKKAIEFTVYKYRGKQGKRGWIIGKKVGRNRIDLKEGFESSAVAREYLEGNQVALEEKLTNLKEIPAHRKESNEPRLGEDYRQGKDVGAEEFRDTFGFRGVEFGNWVDQVKRQQDINEAYDGLMDLAILLDVPPKALSLNSEMGIAFGARGSGGKNAAKAHYEPGKIVINLTKKKGAGSLAHEWWHGLDNYFSRMRGDKVSYLTDSPVGKRRLVSGMFEDDTSVRPEMIDRFKDIVDAIKATDLPTRAKELDKRRTKDYWATTIEMSARSFESYVIGRLKDKGLSNDYLANIASPEYWDAADALGLESANSYPYILEQEMEAVTAAYDAFFQEAQTKETEQGVAIHEPSIEYEAGSVSPAGGVYSGYERSEGQVPSEREGRIEESGQGSLDFSNPAPAIPEEKLQAGDNFRIKYRHTKSAEIKVGVDRVTNAEEAAHVLSHVRKHPEEVFYALVLGKDGEILDVQRHGKGSRDGAIVDPSVIGPSVASVEGATSVYFAHNHPSGMLAPSGSDLNITKQLVEYVDGTGVEVKGHVVFGHNGVVSHFKDSIANAPGVSIKPRLRKRSITVTERKLSKRPELDHALALSNPEQALSIVENEIQSENALILFNNQNVMLGSVTLTPQEMSALRDGDGVSRIVKAIDTTNAVVGVIKSTSEESAKNLARFINKGSKLRLLDAFVRDSAGSYKSSAKHGQGVETSEGAFFSTDDTRETSTPLAQDAVKTIVNRIAANRIGKKARIEIVPSESALPSAIQKQAEEDGATRQIEGVFHRGKVYVVADRMTSEAKVEETLLHEAIGHQGGRWLFGKDVKKAYNKLYLMLGSKGVRDVAAKHDIDIDQYIKTAKDRLKSGTTTYEDHNAFIVDELLAQMQGKKAYESMPTKFKNAVKVLWGAVRDSLRIRGFMTSAKLTDSDLQFLMNKMRKATRKGGEIDKSDRPVFMVAWHGTPHNVDKFSSEKIGTGEGAAAYGHGLYFAGKREVAEWYRDNLSTNNLPEATDETIAYDVLNDYHFDPKEDIDGIVESASDRTVRREMRGGDYHFIFEDGSRLVHTTDDTLEIYGKGEGNLYQVELAPNEDEYLLWDKPLSEQSEKVRDVIASLEDGYGDYGDVSGFGEDIYRAIEQRDGKKEASEYLHSLGIRGIKYLDGSSRGKGEGDYNYVIFNDEDVSIEGNFSRQSRQSPRVQNDEQIVFIGKGPDDYLISTHPSLKDRSRLSKEFSKYFASKGNLSQEAFNLKIEMEGMKGEEEVEVADLAMNVRRVAKTAYSKRYNKLSDEQKIAINSRLQGEDIDLPGELNDAVDAMRIHLDGLSGKMQAMVLENIRYRLDSISPEKRDSALAEITKMRDAIANGVTTLDEAELTLGEIDPYIAGKIRTYFTIEGNKGHYLNRSYQAFDDPSWADKVRKDEAVMEAARNYFREKIFEVEGLEGDVLETRVNGTINSILNAAIEKRDMLSFLSSPQLGQKNLGILRHRKELDPAVMNLLGVYTDPLANYSRTATKMSWLIANHTFLKGIRDQGMKSFLSTRATERMSSIVRPFDPETMSPVTGLYATPEFADALREATDPDNATEMIKFLRKLNGVVKFGKVAIAPTTQVRNFLSAGIGLAMNGHFNVLHATKAFSVTWNDLRSTGKKREYIKELVREGVLHNSVRAGEMTTYLDDVVSSDKWASGLRGSVKRTGDFFATLYRMGDDFWKVIAYENEKTSIKRWYGLSEAEAKKKAAERIRNGYMTYSHVPKAIRHLRRNVLVGAFVSFPAEVIRTTKNQFVIMGEDARAGHMVPVARRVVGMAAAFSVIEMLAEKAMDAVGFGDDDDEAMHLLSAEYARNSRFYYSRDDEGNLVKMDLSYIDLYGNLKRPIYALLNDNNEGVIEKLGDAITEIAEPFIGWDILSGAVFEILANKKRNGGPVYNETDSREKQAADIAEHLARAAAPGVATNIERISKAITGEVSSSGRKYTLRDEAAALGGMRWSTVDVSTAMRYRIGDFKHKRSEASRILSRELRNPNDLSRKDLKAIWTRMSNARDRVFSDTHKLVIAAQKLGMSKKQLNHLISANGVGDRDRYALMNGTPSPYRLTRVQKKGVVKRALGGVEDPVERTKIKNRVRERFELLLEIQGRR